jgi:predicted phage-related endonuclease
MTLINVMQDLQAPIFGLKVRMKWAQEIVVEGYALDSVATKWYTAKEISIKSSGADLIMGNNTFKNALNVTVTPCDILNHHYSSCGNCQYERFLNLLRSEMGQFG